jgi:hypothetical protein
MKRTQYSVGVEEVPLDVEAADSGESEWEEEAMAGEGPTEEEFNKWTICMLLHRE